MLFSSIIHILFPSDYDALVCISDSRRNRRKAQYCVAVASLFFTGGWGEPVYLILMYSVLQLLHGYSDYNEQKYGGHR